MKGRLKYLYLMCTIVLIGCTSRQENKKFNKPYTHELQASNEFLRIRLDSLTGFRHISFRVDRYDDSEVLSFINRQNNSLYIYNTADGNLINKVNLEVAGPDGVGNLSAGSHYIHSSDSIFIYNPNYGQLFLVNKSGKIIYKNQLFDFNNDNAMIMPEPISLAKIQRFETKLFFPSIFAKRLRNYDIPSFVTYDILTHEVENVFNYPKEYSKAHWGATFKYLGSIAVNNNDKKLFISYPIKEDLVLIDYSKNPEKKELYAGSEYIKQVTPFSSDIDDAIVNKSNEYYQSLTVHALSNSDYACIIYDQFQNLYYRIAYIRPNEEEVKDGNRLAHLSIIVLDRKLEKIAEKLLDNERYDVSMVDVTKQGIAVARKDLYKLDENSTHLELFQLKELKND